MNYKLLFLSFFSSLLIAGSNTTVPFASTDRMSSTYVNQYVTALAGDLLPRTNGIVAASVASLGNSSYAWRNITVTSAQISSRIAYPSWVLSEQTQLSFAYEGTTKVQLDPSSNPTRYWESSSSGTFGQTGTAVAEADVTNLSITPTISNNAPLLIMLQPDATVSTATDEISATFAITGTGRAHIRLYRGATLIQTFTIAKTQTSAALTKDWACSAIRFYDDPGNGTFTYKVTLELDMDTVSNVSVSNCKLVAALL